MTGTLYLVATPIGNLGDMTFRAVETLKKVALIACEDTRRARILCDKFGIEPKLSSLPAFDEQRRAEPLLERLRQGEDLALITDAGSPGISDPGTALVQLALAEGLSVVPIPGPAAVIAALSASGLATDRFYFAGFLPRKGTAREEQLSVLKRLPATVVMYESPERLAETLVDLKEAFGDRRAVVARELTKVHEEFARGTLSELAQKFAEGARGELTILVEGAGDQSALAASDEAILAEVKRRLAGGEGSVKEIAREIAQATGRPRSEVYALALKAKE